MFERNRDKEKVELSKDAYKKARRFFRFLRPYRSQFIIGWIFLVLSSLTAMLFPALMGQLLGAKEGQEAIFTIEGIDLTNLNVIIMVMLIVFAAQAVFSFFRIFIFTNVTEKSLKGLKLAAFEKLIVLPLDFYNRNKVGELTSRIATDINLIQKTLQTTLAEFFRQFITIAVAFCVLLYFSWELALWMLAVIPLLAIVAIVFGRYIRKLSKRAQEQSAKSNAILEEVLMGIVNVKAFTAEKHESSRYEKRIDNIAGLNIKSGIMRGLFVSFIIFCMFGGIAFIIWKAKGLETAEVITLAEFNAFILYTIFLGASFGSVPDLYAEIQKAIGSTEHLMDILDEEEEEKGEHLLENFKGSVRFKDLNFSYPQRSEIQVLNSISFECRPGVMTALVGSSGVGKSTISSLLLKFYKPDKGAIYFDDQDIQDVNTESLRSQIALVPQEVLLFSGSILENVLYGKPGSSIEEVEAALKQANAYDFVTGFPDKMETVVGDRGVQLSGGQRQRIAIARAVLKDPKILILDEATSALDSESEKLVQEALEKLMMGRTSFVIAHRLSTIRNADNILVLDQGEIVESGTHEQLLGKETGIYKKLIETQMDVSTLS